MRPHRTPYGEIRHEIAEGERRRAAEAGRVDHRSDEQKRSDALRDWLAVSAFLIVVLAGLFWRLR